MSNWKYIGFLIGLLWIAQGRAQNSCPNSDFSLGDFTNWTGYTSVYPRNTPGANIGNTIPYYYNTGIVNGRQTIITQSTPDPFTCGNVMTIPPGENVSVRLGNGGIGPWGNGVRWERDYLEYTISVSPSNALLIYKYAVVLQDPNSDPGIAPHADPIKPRFVVSIKDENGALIDPTCGVYSVTADETVEGFRNCTQGEAAALGGRVNSAGSTIYRAWTTVGVDLRNFIGQDVTILFETWDCGLGGHFGYAYLTAKCDSLAITAQSCGANDGVTLTAPEGFSYLWSTGQSTQTIQIPNAVAGDTVRVLLTTKSGCTSEVYTVLNPAKIKSVFKADKLEICQDDSITFTDSSWSKFIQNNTDIPITKWTWKFGDGTIDASNNLNPTHQFTDFGLHKVVLVVENDFGCKDSSFININVNPYPVVNFSYEPNCEGKTTTFDNKSLIPLGNINQSLWRFGDGTTSSESDPSHTYALEGIYDVTLIQTSDKGCVDSLTQQTASLPKPRASFTGGQACTGDTLFFNSSSTFLPNDTIKKYRWNFGDNTSLSNLKNTNHVFHEDGIFNVQLTIETNWGCTDDTIIPVKILEGPEIDFEVENVCLNSPVNFNNASSPVDSINIWEWDFGDNSAINTNFEPSHTYTSSSFFTVTLTGTTINGCSASKSKTLQVAPNPNVNFKKTDVCLGSSIDFKDQSIISSGFITKWKWDFDNDSISSNQNESITYKTDGTYNVKLIAESDLGCQDSITKSVIVKGLPLPNFIADTVCRGLPTNFTNLTVGSSSNPITYLWNFGDGAPLEFQTNVSHVYAKDTIYDVQLQVTQNGCSTDTSIQILVLPLPEVNFDYQSVCKGTPTELINTTTSLSPVVNWKWIFPENNSTQTTENASFTSSSATSFNVELSATAENGCTNKIVKSLSVTPNPIVDFNTQSKCEGQEMIFTSLATVARGYIKNWEWDLSDNTITSEKDPRHTFNASGLIPIKLKVETVGGCFDSITKMVEVYSKPEADFEVPSVCLGETSDFTDLSSIQNGYSIASWIWNVGDGSLLKSQKNIQHQYQVAKTYDVELQITSNKGCKDTLKKQTIVHQLPVLDFTNSNVCFGSPTQFTNTSEDLSSIASWKWDFLDGSTDTLESPNYTFPNTGEVFVELTGTDTNNCASTIQKKLIVKPLPFPVLDADHYDGCAPQCMQFSDYSTAPLDTISSWIWSFGDGDSSDVPFPEHCYENPGIYDVSLTVTTVNGCANTFEWDEMIKIYIVPTAGFTYGPQPTDMRNPTITFQDASLNGDFYRWDFGDNNVSTDQNTFNEYKTYGDYDVKQTVSTRNGCFDTITQQVRIEPIFDLLVPNSFSPNGDGINDIFLPQGYGYDTNPEKYTFVIYNRWGEKIFETNDVNEGWDGRVNTFEFGNTGRVQQMDVYVWKVIVHDITSSSKRHEQVGIVTLIK